jgi:hypothetical protein
LLAMRPQGASSSMEWSLKQSRCFRPVSTRIRIRLMKAASWNSSSTLTMMTPPSLCRLPSGTLWIHILTTPLKSFSSFGRTRHRKGTLSGWELTTRMWLYNMTVWTNKIAISTTSRG